MTINHPGFFNRAGPFTVADVAARLGAEIPEGVPAAIAQAELKAVAPIDTAGPGDVTFLDNVKYRDLLALTRASAVIVRAEARHLVPETAVPLITNAPYHGFARALAEFYPAAVRPEVLRPDAGGLVDPTAVIEDGAIIEPGAMIGAEAEIGAGARICAGAVVGRRCAIGRDTVIGPNAVVVCALIGNRVILHAGVRVGQDGFGFAMSPTGHLKVPQIGRVIIQDDVEIGANTTIDRGALKDTIIGEGSKIDNLVQIGHNVVLGRHCVIVAQVGISGSAELGDFVVMGGQSGAVGHIRVGTGAQIAGAAHAKNDVPAGARMGGTPARPLREWAREVAALRRLAKRGSSD